MLGQLQYGRIAYTQQQIGDNNCLDIFFILHISLAEIFPKQTFITPSPQFRW